MIMTKVNKVKTKNTKAITRSYPRIVFIKEFIHFFHMPLFLQYKYI